MTTTKFDIRCGVCQKPVKHTNHGWVHDVLLGSYPVLHRELSAVFSDPPAPHAPLHRETVLHAADPVRTQG